MVLGSIPRLTQFFSLINLESSFTMLLFKKIIERFSVNFWKSNNFKLLLLSICIWPKYNIFKNFHFKYFYFFRLTAYTALAFTQAKPFIFIDNKIIEKSLEWLLNVQGKNGSFYETGNVIHSELQSNQGNSLALTAFVTMTFLESGQVCNFLMCLMYKNSSINFGSER